MMELKHLSFSYGKQGPEVLSDLSTAIQDGALVAVLGPNGAGKTTLFKCILGLFRNYQGEILIDDREVRTMRRKELAAKVAYIPQSEAPVYNYTVFDSVLMGTTGMLSPLKSPGEEQKKVAREAICRLGIENLMDRGVNEISGGERQLMLLARAMAQNAKILIMDEPTANLDYGNQQLVLNRVREMAEDGYLILLSTHNPEHALQYATHVLAIKDHKIWAQGCAGEVLDEELIYQIYGLKAVIVETEIDGRIVRSCIPSAKEAEKERERK